MGKRTSVPPLRVRNAERTRADQDAIDNVVEQLWREKLHDAVERCDFDMFCVYEAMLHNLRARRERRCREAE